MSGFRSASSGSGASNVTPSSSFGSLTPSRPAPPVPTNKHNDPFLPPLSAYQSGGGTSPGNGPGAGGGSYTGPLRPAGPAAAGSFGSGWQQAGPGATTGGSSIVRKGYVSVKEDGIRSWIWSKRWLALREQTLTFHKNEASISSLSFRCFGESNSDHGFVPLAFYRPPTNLPHWCSSRRSPMSQGQISSRTASR